MQALLARLRARLIDDWRRAWRLSTIWLHGAVLLLVAAYELAPVLPAEVQAVIPDHVRPQVLGFYAVAGIVLRLIKQKTNG